MAEDWAGIAAEIKDAIASVGFSVTLTRRVPVGDNLDDYYQTIDQTVTLRAIDAKPVRTTFPTPMETTISRTIVVDAVTFTPEVGDMVSVGGVSHIVEKVSAVSPGGSDLLFRLGLAA